MDRKVTGIWNVRKQVLSVSVLTPRVFSICDTSGSDFGVYQGGGIVTLVKMPKTVSFVSIGHCVCPGCKLQYPGL